MQDFYFLLSIFYFLFLTFYFSLYFLLLFFILIQYRDSEVSPCLCDQVVTPYRRHRDKIYVSRYIFLIAGANVLYGVI